jgi:hypothetical protein
MPSFSWASTDARVYFIGVSDPHPTLLDAEVDVMGSNPLGQLRWGLLKLNAGVWSAEMVFMKWEGQQPSGQVRVYDFKAKGEVFEASWRVDLDHALRWSSFDDADGVRRRAVAAAFDNDHPSATLAVMGFSGKSLLTSSPTRS